MTQTVTPAIISLVNALFAEGYTGEVKLVNKFPKGSECHFDTGALAVCLSGFCKEELYIADDHKEIVFVGRYDVMLTVCGEPTVEDVVNLAWYTYKTHKPRGYDRPREFEALFIKHGHLKLETITTLVEQE